MTLTDVYEKLVEAEEEARHKRAERHRTELLLERIQREIEITVPKRRQEQREYEHSIKQMADMQERFQDALQYIVASISVFCIIWEIMESDVIVT